MLKKKQVVTNVLRALLPTPQTDSYRVSRAFPRCMPSISNTMHFMRAGSERGQVISVTQPGNSESSRAAMGQVSPVAAQDLLTLHWSLGCKNDSPVCYSEVDILIEGRK